MASIYEHSYVTLAASVAEGSDAGCFVCPPPFWEGYITNGTSKAGVHNYQAVLELIQSSPQAPIPFVRGASERWRDEIDRRPVANTRVINQNSAPATAFENDVEQRVRDERA